MVTSFKLQCADQSVTGQSNTLELDGLVTNTTYECFVLAINAFGEGPKNSFSVTTENDGVIPTLMEMAHQTVLMRMMIMMECLMTMKPTTVSTP